MMKIMDYTIQWQAITVLQNADKLMEIKGIGLVMVRGFIAEVGDIEHFDIVPEGHTQGHVEWK